MSKTVRRRAADAQGDFSVRLSTKTQSNHQTAGVNPEFRMITLIIKCAINSTFDASGPQQLYAVGDKFILRLVGEVN